MNNPFKEAEGYLKYLSSKSGGYNITGTYNPTNGFLVDLVKCSMGLFQGISITTVAHLHKMWDDYFAIAPKDMIGLQFCTSHGAILTKNALETYPENLRKRIRVIGIAPAAYFGYV